MPHSNHSDSSELRHGASGALSVVATPIGNLLDLSPRAVDTLKLASLILVEDTRTFSTLARRFDIQTTTKSYFEHNEKSRVEEIVALLEQGQNIALVSEAGTPTISDPGYRLIRACRQRQIPVVGIPGPNAAILALSISGLPSDRFLFQGFLPQRPGRRLTALKSLLDFDATGILYESPHRLIRTLGDIAEHSPKREVFVGRELTKLHEECRFGLVEDVLAHFCAKDSIRGEIVIVIARQSEVAEEEAE